MCIKLICLYMFLIIRDSIILHYSYEFICLDHYKLCIGQLLETCSFWAICKQTLKFIVIFWYTFMFRNKRNK